MPHTDPIADFVTRIRNACLAKNADLVVPYSGVKERLAKILLEEGYIGGCEVVGEGVKRGICIRLKYHSGLKRVSVINRLKRVSRPGCRVYYDVKRLPQVQNGMGIGIISTSKGIMTDKKARAEAVGGEYMCMVW
jgi:small subunit ribosomal protein S8